jgi:peptidoglycan/LPS O-acetylase OafA/YrhL
MPRALTKHRLAELDGLRGFALVMILAFHSIYQEGELTAGSFFAGLQRLVALDWTAGICLTYGIAKLSWLYFEGRRNAAAAPISISLPCLPIRLSCHYACY